MSVQIYIDCKNLILDQIVSIISIFSLIDKHDFANVEIELWSSNPEYHQFCKPGIKFYFHYEISIFKLYPKSNASQINSEEKIILFTRFYLKFLKDLQYILFFPMCYQISYLYGWIMLINSKMRNQIYA